MSREQKRLRRWIRHSIAVAAGLITWAFMAAFFYRWAEAGLCFLCGAVELWGCNMLGRMEAELREIEMMEELEEAERE